MHKTTVIVVLALGLTVASLAQDNLVRNPSFEQGDQTPAGWTLSAEPGKWEQAGHTGSRCVSVEGTKQQQSNSWGQGGIPVQPFSTYRFSFWAKVAPGTTGGCIISGPDFCNRDVQAGDKWSRRSHVFVTGTTQTEMSVRLGHWQKTGSVLFDDVDVHPVVPVHRTVEGLTLGAGEKTADGAYEFAAPLGDEGANFCRALADFNADFNSNRWVFGPGRHVVYRHETNGAEQTAARVSVNIGYHTSGHCVVEASKDGKQYVHLGRIGEVATEEYEIPASLMPAKVIYVRMRSPGKVEPREDSHPGSFQIHGYDYSAQLDRKLPDLQGSTRYLDVTASDPRIAVTVDDLGSLMPAEDNVARIRVRNSSDRALSAVVELEISRAVQAGEPVSQVARAEVQVAAKAEAPVRIEYAVPGAGDYELGLRVTQDNTQLFAAATTFTVPSLYAAGYGHPLGSDDSCDLWWCEGTYKVSRERAPAVGEAQPVKLSAARNEFEPAQVVLRPKRDLNGLTAQASDLAGPDGAKLSADNVDLCYVWYHFVKRPTDKAGCVGWWPDALPPLDEPIDLKANENQPLWITVKVPKETPAGEYKGTVSLKAENWSASVPLQLRVWDFTLPDESTVASAFGLSQGNIWRYNNITNEADRESVWDLYMQNFRDHRIAPYAFWRRGIKVEFTGLNWTGGDIVQEAPFEGDNCLKIVDEDEKGAVSVFAAKRIDVEPAAPYVFTFAARAAEPGQKYLVTFQSYDAAGNWISGHNLDIQFAGSGEWQQETLTFVPQERSPNARSLLLVLRPALWSEDGKHTGTVWFDNLKLVKEGTEQSLIADGGFELGDSAIHAKVDFTEWDKEAEKYLDGYHFTGFRLPLSGMGGGTFHSRHYGQIGPFKQGTPEYRRVFKEYCMQLQNHLEEKGWLDKAYIYWFDEPAPKDYDFVREGMEEIKRAGPKLRRMLTEEPNEALIGAVDIWCPVLHNHEPDICAERQEFGETIWWYVCCGPKAPWPGLFIDHNAVDLRVWLWMTWKWNVEAVLVWQSNYWTSYCAYPDEPQNPYEDPMGYVSGYSHPKGYIGYWGNGDGRFIYPANKDVNADKSPHIAGPVNSIRWEMLREGIEDFEYFALLKELVAKRGECPQKALLGVPEQIVAGHREFTKDPLPMYAHREKLARAIEQLSGE